MEPLQTRGVLANRSAIASACRKSRLKDAQSPRSVLVLCPQSNWDVCPRWLNGAALTSCTLGMSGYDTENLTANHSGALCVENRHVPCMLKTTAGVGI